MSTSLIYHAFGAKTYNYRRTEYKEGAIWLHLQKKPLTVTDFGGINEVDPLTSQC